MLYNPKTVTEIQLLEVMYDSKHTYFESRFFCVNDTGITRVSKMLKYAHTKGLLSYHKFPSYRYPFYKLTDEGNAVAVKAKKKNDQKINNLNSRVKAFLKTNDGSTSKEISRGIKKSHKDTINTLRELSSMDVVYMVKEEKQLLWYIEE